MGRRLLCRGHRTELEQNPSPTEHSLLIVVLPREQRGVFISPRKCLSSKRKPVKFIIDVNAALSREPLREGRGSVIRIHVLGDISVLRSAVQQ